MKNYVYENALCRYGLRCEIVQGSTCSSISRRWCCQQTIRATEHANFERSM